MLVLARRSLESIRIGDEIEVRVLAIEGNRVKLGIVAPAAVRVARAELLAAVAAENARAVASPRSAAAVARLCKAVRRSAVPIDES